MRSDKKHTCVVSAVCVLLREFSFHEMGVPLGKSVKKGRIASFELGLGGNAQHPRDDPATPVTGKRADLLLPLKPNALMLQDCSYFSLLS